MTKRTMLGALFAAGLVALISALALIFLGYGDDVYAPPMMLGGLAVMRALRDVP